MQVHWQKSRLVLPQAPALAIGNFDGVHRGHQALLARLNSIAQKQNLSSMVMSFFPHPKAVVSQKAPPIITTLRDRAAWLAHYGVEHWTLLSFTQKLRHFSPEDFVSYYLSNRLGIRHLLVGDDFRFGYRGRGDVALLHTLADQFGFDLTVLPSVGDDEIVRVSSSAVRQAVANHDIDRACALLGHPLTLTGRVHHGAKRGREMTTPTANIHVPDDWCPPNGVYVVRVQVLPDGDYLWGIANLGVAPTFHGTRRKLEVHAFSPIGQVYGQFLRVELKHFIRSEQRFEHREALQIQIQRDIAHTQAYIARVDFCEIRKD